MKLLYLSCHAILEYDELKLYEELGIDYFSLGSYIDPQNPADPIRPALSRAVDRDLLAIAPDRDHLTPEFLEPFDTIVVMHKPEWIVNNWPLLKSKRVIWRSIGQSTTGVEQMLRPFRVQGLEVVRYSVRESHIEGNIGADAVIYFYKDPDEFKDYNGAQKQLITLAQNMKHRDEHCNYVAFLQIIAGKPAKLYGVNNEASGELSGGMLTYEEMRQVMRDNRAYIYTGTQPACYTLNFIEAMMTGIPMVCIGPKYGNSLQISGNMYEPPDIITNGVNGFISDDIVQLREVCDRLLNDVDYAKQIGSLGRQTAISLFGKDNIMRRWKEFLGLWKISHNY